MATDQTGQVQPSGKVNLMKMGSVEILKAQMRRNRPKSGTYVRCTEGDDGTLIDVDLNIVLSALPTITLQVCSGGVTQNVTLYYKP